MAKTAASAAKYELVGPRPAERGLLDGARTGPDGSEALSMGPGAMVEAPGQIPNAPGGASQNPSDSRASGLAISLGGSGLVAAGSLQPPYGSPSSWWSADNEDHAESDYVRHFVNLRNVLQREWLQGVMEKKAAQRREPPPVIPESVPERVCRVLGTPVSELWRVYVRRRPAERIQHNTPEDGAPSLGIQGGSPPLRRIRL